uniref:Cytochrome P450 n=1 Tax=Ascotis selenaria TaxID=414916 RepID=A0A455R6G9_9NEOP|nr:cytochrome P450 [Ascotis selenaria]
MFFLIVLLSLSLCIIWRYLKSKDKTEPPALSGWLPLIGHGKRFFINGFEFYRSFEKISEECLRKGGVVTLYLGFNKVYCVSDPDDCLTVMNMCLEKSMMIKFAKQFLGNGLFTADVHRWQTSRKLLNPAFNQKILDSFIDIFNNKARELANIFATEIGKPFDHQISLRTKNLETICATSFDVHDSESRNILNQYLPLLATLVIKLSQRLQCFWLHNDFIYSLSSLKRETDEIVKKTKVLCSTMIKKNRIMRLNRASENDATGKPKKFIDLILDLSEETDCFTDEQIREESDTVVVGGHDTSASTLTFAFTLLGSHPHAQQKLYQEIIRVCGTSDKDVEKQDLSKLVYTEAVLKETLRLYPIALLLPRYIDRDVKLKNYTLKANSDCFVMANGLHRHAIWGEDAEQFRPERWLDKDTLPDAKYYAAFGLGRRSCIGRAYALMSMKIVVVHVLRRFSISSDVSKMEVSLSIVSRPERGHSILLKRR